MNESAKPRTVRSYVRRQGRITSSQSRALNELLPRWGLSESNPASLDALSQSDKPLFLEIGFGNGIAMSALAQQHRDVNFIGVEVHRPGVGHLLLDIEKHELTNVHVFHGDCDGFMELISCTHDKRAAESTSTPSTGSAQDANKLTSAQYQLQFDGILIWFPDPWPKKKHHKRRLIQAAFVERLKPLLKPNGYLHLATDWQPYADWMRDEMRVANWSYIENPATLDQFLERPPSKYEQRGLRLGHQVSDLIYCPVK